MITKKQLRNEIGTLRDDMAAEFVKRDDEIVTVRTEGIRTANELDKLTTRLKNIEEYVSMQTDSIAALILACGLREDDKFNKATKDAVDHASKIDEPKKENLTETKSTVYADEIFKDDWVTGPEVAKMIGWKTCNVRMLRSAGISFIQAGKGRNLKIYLPDVSKYIQKRDNKKNKAK